MGCEKLIRIPTCILAEWLAVWRSVKISGGGVVGVEPPGKHGTPTANAGKKSWGGVELRPPLAMYLQLMQVKKSAQLELKLKF